MFEMDLGHWIDISNVGIPYPQFRVPLEFRLDRLSLLFCILSSLITVATAVCVSHAPLGQRRRNLALLAIHFTTMLLLYSAQNFVVLLMFWELSSQLAYFIVRNEDAGFNSKSEQTIGSLFLCQRLSSVSLLGMTMMIWTVSAGMDVSQFAGGAFLEKADETTLDAVGGIVACSLVVILSRCAFAPFFLQMDAVRNSSAAAATLLHSGTLIPSGLYLAIRLRPAYEQNLWLAGGLMTVAALSAVVAALIALFEPNSQVRRAYLAVAMGAIVVMGYGVLGSESLTATLGLLSVSTLIQCMWMLSTPQSADEMIPAGIHRGLALVAGLVLASGLMGQNAILASIKQTAVSEQDRRALLETYQAVRQEGGHQLGDERENVVSIPDRTAMLSAAYRMTNLAMFLFALAVFYPLFMSRHHKEQGVGGEPNRESHSFYRYGKAVMAGFFLTAAAVGPLLSRPFGELFPLAEVSNGEVGQIELSSASFEFAWEWGTIAAAIGISVALAASSLNAKRIKPLAIALGPIIRLGQERFYFEKIIQFSVIWPTRLAATVFNLMDRTILHSLATKSLDGAARQLAIAVHPLNRESRSIFGVATLLMLAALLAVMLW